MKYIFPLIFCISLYTHTLADSVAKAEPPHVEYHYVQKPPPPPPKSNLDQALDEGIQILLDQGLAGVIIIVLLGWTWKESKANRSIQKENFEKFVEISQECSGHMASVSARLENIEREMEQSKTLQMMQKG